MIQRIERARGGGGGEHPITEQFYVQVRMIIRAHTGHPQRTQPTYAHTQLGTIKLLSIKYTVRMAGQLLHCNSIPCAMKSATTYSSDGGKSFLIFFLFLVAKVIGNCMLAQHSYLITSFIIFSGLLARKCFYLIFGFIFFLIRKLSDFRINNIINGLSEYRFKCFSFFFFVFFFLIYYYCLYHGFGLNILVASSVFLMIILLH